MDRSQLVRFFWVVLAGLVSSLAAIVLLVRSGRVVPGPTAGGTRPREPGHATRMPHA